MLTALYARSLSELHDAALLAEMPLILVSHLVLPWFVTRNTSAAKFHKFIAD